MNSLTDVVLSSLLASMLGISSTSAANTATSEPSTPRTVRLHDGVTASVIAIANMEYPDESWQADGTPLKNSHWKLPKQFEISNLPATHEARPCYAMILRFSDAGDDPPTPYAFSLNGYAIEYDSFNPAPDAPHERGTYLKGIIVRDQSDETSGTLYFNTGVGHFETSKPTEDFSYDGGQSFGGKTPDGTYVVGHAIVSGNRLLIPVSTTVTNFEFRVAAKRLDLSGKIQIGEQFDENQTDPIVQRIVEFDGLDDVRKLADIAIQFRPMNTVFFKGLALKSGQPSTVRMATRSISTTLPSGACDEVDVVDDVRRPGIYVISDRLKTVSQMLTAAEIVDLKHDTVSLRRHFGKDMSAVFEAISASQITPGSAHDIPMQGNDELYIERESR